MATLNLERINELLETSLIGCSVDCPNELWDSIDSTNIRASALAGQSPSEGTIILSREQTAGRGRLGRTWISKPDAGVYMSILLRPKSRPLTELSLLTMACGVAVSSAVEKTSGVFIGLKWVNDLIYDGRKLGGILCETAGRASSYVVVGIGLNVALDIASVSKDIQDRVDSLDRISKTEIDSNLLVCTVVKELEQRYKLLLAGGDDAILQEWRARSVTIGQSVRANLGTRTIIGVAKDVTASGALVIECEDGSIERLNAGEVQIRRHDGAYC